MWPRSVGFVGGGRVTRIMLNGLKNAGRFPARVVVSDTSVEVLRALQQQFPDIEIAVGDNRAAAAQQVVFVALHPPAFAPMLEEIRPCLGPDTVFVSLAPKWSISKLGEKLGGFSRIVRMIPNAPSIINHGYNPLAFAPDFPETQKRDLIALFKALGECPEVDESKLEAYAVLTAMGPTYLWFQWQELATLAESFGLSKSEVQQGMQHMVSGAVATMYDSGLSPADVMDLIPVKPLAEDETTIRETYRNRLGALYAKLKS